MEVAPVRERDDRLDALKALAILGVILGHAISTPFGHDARSAPVGAAIVFTLLTGLHLPVFMFVAGRLTKPGMGAAWLGGRALRLLVPYLAWAAVQWPVWFRSQSPAQYAVHIVLQPQATNALWFLYVLFECSAIFALVRGNRRTLAVIAGALVLLPMPPIGYLGVTYAAKMLPFMVAGYLTREWKLSAQWWLVPLAALLVVPLWAGAGSNLLWSQPAWAATVAAAGGPAGTQAVGLVLRLLRLAMPLAGVGAMFWAVAGGGPAWLRSLGVMSLGLYCAHILFLRYHVPGPPYAAIVTAFVAAVAGAVAVTLVLQWSRWAAFVFLGSGRVPSRR